jgi:SRSO17 transposase
VYFVKGVESAENGTHPLPKNGTLDTSTERYREHVWNGKQSKLANSSASGPGKTMNLLRSNPNIALSSWIGQRAYFLHTD